MIIANKVFSGLPICHGKNSVLVSDVKLLLQIGVAPRDLCYRFWEIVRASILGRGFTFIVSGKLRSTMPGLLPDLCRFIDIDLDAATGMVKGLSIVYHVGYVGNLRGVDVNPSIEERADLFLEAQDRLVSRAEQELEDRVMARMDERFDQFVDQLSDRMDQMMNRRGNRNVRGTDDEQSENPFGEDDDSSYDEQSGRRLRRNQRENNRRWESCHTPRRGLDEIRVRGRDIITIRTQSNKKRPLRVRLKIQHRCINKNS
ncbi:hypothetical protein Tco_0228498 [Tanacetum coccineum]